MNHSLLLRRVASVAFATIFLGNLGAASDWRNIRNGWEIPSEHYADMPYVVVNDDGSWLCTLTTGVGTEGNTGQHVVATRSSDFGRTWSPLVDIEPSSGPESSWAMPLLGQNGRVYVFYTYNHDNIRSVKIFPAGATQRVDTIGHYVFRYSDDGGHTWSPRRYQIPMRATGFDHENVYGGDVNGDGVVDGNDAKFFWAEGKPVIVNRSVYIGASKVRNFGKTFIAESEGILFRSDDLLVHEDPAHATWMTLPDGETGLRSPLGHISEECKVVSLSDGSLYAVTRTATGYLAAYRSSDGGQSWTDPAFATYEPGGRPIKNPRANCTIRKFGNGKYLMWYHNHSGTTYSDRNPGWISGGVEKEGTIFWSEPEILLYDPDPDVRISYPDMFEVDGRYFITESQKSAARVHEIDTRLLEALWSQFDNKCVATEGLAASWEPSHGSSAVIPKLSNISERGGFTIEFWARIKSVTAGQVLFDSRDGDGRGVRIAVTSLLSLRVEVSDGDAFVEWDCDPGILAVGHDQHIAITVDGGPKVITCIVDGRLCDGGSSRQYGWTRFAPNLGDVRGTPVAKVGNNEAFQLLRLRVYARHLLTSEVIGNYRAERGLFQSGSDTSN